MWTQLSHISGFVWNKSLGLYSGKVLDLAILRLKCRLKVKTFVSAKFCLKTVFTKGDFAKFQDYQITTVIFCVM